MYQYVNLPMLRTPNFYRELQHSDVLFVDINFPKCNNSCTCF